jgi:hypothetical protein
MVGSIVWRAALRHASMGIILVLWAGCGPSTQDLALAQAEITRLHGELDAAKRRHEEDERNYSKAEQDIEELQRHIRDVPAISSTEQDLRDRLVACEERDCPARCNAASSAAPAQVDTSPATVAVPDGAPTYARTIPYEGNGGGPTLCADGQVSGSSGRGTCSHHGGMAGARHRKH